MFRGVKGFFKALFLYTFYTAGGLILLALIVVGAMAELGFRWTI